MARTILITGVSQGLGNAMMEGLEDADEGCVIQAIAQNPVQGLFLKGR